MSLSIAEVYLLLFRKSMVPILGEAVPTPFDGQIELDGWSWNLTHDEDDDTKAGKGKDKDKEKSAKTSAAMKSLGADDGIVKKIEAIQNNERLPQAQRNKQVLDKLRETQKARDKAADKAADKEDGDAAADSTEDNRLTFKFTKGVDLASTQMMNCLKTNEVLPRAVLTLFHRSVNAPLTLVVTFKKVVLTEYSLDVDVSDTMSDMKEQWTARFEEVDYVYQNRPGTGGVPGVTQGTARVFKMKLKSLF
jgi:type VI protein secretion system component Hcp